MDFDPDEYLRSKEPVPNEDDFDPDAYLQGRGVDIGAEAANEVQAALQSPVLHALGGQKTINLAQKIGQNVDVYTGSRAARRAVGEALDKVNLGFETAGPAGFAKTAGEEFGRSYGKDVPAPTGKEIVRKTDIGKSLPEWAADVAGFGTEVLLDPSIAIPAGSAARVAKTGAEAGMLGIKGVGKGAAMAGKGLGIAADTLVPGATKMIKIPAEKAGKIAQSLLKYVRPEVRPEFVRAVETAVEFGIDPSILPSSVKYRGGPESTISLLERTRAQGITGEPHKAAFNEALNKVRGAYDGEGLRYSGGKQALHPTEAGEAIRNSYNQTVDRFFRDNDITYDTTWKQVPGITLGEKEAEQVISTIGGARRKALAMTRRGATPEIKGQGQALVEILDNAEKVVRDGNYKQATELMRELGEVGFKRIQGVLPANKKIHRDLYHAISDALIDTSEKSLGKDFAKTLRARNEGFTKFFENQKRLGLNLDDDTISGELLFKQAVQSGNSTTIRALKELLKNDPATLSQLKATFLDQAKTIDKEGGFVFGQLNRAIKNNEATERVLRELFDAPESDRVRRLVQLGDDFGPPILNYSGTERSNVLRRWAQSVPEALSNDWIIDYLKSGAQVDPGDLKRLNTVSPGIIPPKPPKGGSSTLKFAEDIASDPWGSAKRYFENLAPTRRQVLGKGLQEYAVQKDGDRQTAVLSRVSGTQYEAQLRRAAEKGADDFNIVYYMLSQSDPEFRRLLGGK